MRVRSKNKAISIKSMLVYAVIASIVIGVTGCGAKDVDTTSPVVNESEDRSMPELEDDEIDTDGAADTGDAQDISQLDVYNNNAHFVRRGDKVYFRMPNTLNYHEVALWGEYADVASYSQALMEYSLEDSKLTTLLHDSGSGIMGLGGNYLFFRDVEFNNDIECEVLASIDLSEDGHTYNQMGFGDEIVGTTPDGKYTLSLSYSYTTDGIYMASINVYEQTIYVDSYDLEDFYGIAGFSNDNLFYWTSEYLIQLNIVTGEVVNLGKIPVAEYGACEVEEFMVIDGKLYIGLAYYEGTGHFYSSGYHITAEIDKENSLTNEQLTNSMLDSDYEDNEAYVPFYVEDGKQILTDGIPETAYIGYSDGVIGYYDEQGHKVDLVRGFETVYDDSYTCMIDVELAELVGDKLFFIKNTNIHVPDEDIGWRTAYMRIRAEYYMVDITTKKIERIADIKAYDYGSYQLP